MNKHFQQYVREWPAAVKAILSSSLHQVYNGFGDTSKVVQVDYTEVYVDEGRRTVVLKEHAVTWANDDYYIVVGYDYIDDIMYVLRNSAYAA